MRRLQDAHFEELQGGKNTKYGKGWRDERAAGVLDALTTPWQSAGVAFVSFRFAFCLWLRTVWNLITRWCMQK